MAKTKLSMDMPKIGDKLKRLTIDYSVEDCVVTYVNSLHGWYEVLFPKFNIKECYKLPTYDHSIFQGKSLNDYPIICVETGWVYNSINECSEDMNLDRTNIFRQLNGEHSHCGGYHFTNAL